MAASDQDLRDKIMRKCINVLKPTEKPFRSVRMYVHRYLGHKHLKRIWIAKTGVISSLLSWRVIPLH